MVQKKWKTIIEPKTGWFDINLNEVWKYRDLILMFVKRNYTTQYKQTILGPLWFLISPFMTTLMFTFVFGKIANISTDGVPQFIFYMAGNITWGYFANCLNQTSNTFVTNAAVFGKVYFPRLTTPISTVITGLINFGIQFILFIGFLLYFMNSSTTITPNWWILITPILIIQMALLGLGFGIIISSLTTKYRDLSVLVGFGVQLWMYITPIVYPLSSLSSSNKTLIMMNPMAPIIEIFKHAYLGRGEIHFYFYCISWLTTLVVLFIGVILFNRVEKTFMDTV